MIFYNIFISPIELIIDWVFIAAYHYLSNADLLKVTLPIKDGYRIKNGFFDVQGWEEIEY